MVAESYPSSLSFEELAAALEHDAAVLDRELRLDVSADESEEIFDLGRIARQILATDPTLREDKRVRDQRWRQAISARLLVLTDQIRHRDLTRAKETISTIKLLYERQTRLCVRLVHGKAAMDKEDVEVETILDESIEAVLQLDMVINALVETYRRDAVAAVNVSHCVETALTGDLVSLQPLLRGEDISPESYARKLANVVVEVIPGASVVEPQNVEHAGQIKGTKYIRPVAATAGAGVLGNRADSLVGYVTHEIGQLAPGERGASAEDEKSAPSSKTIVPLEGPSDFDSGRNVLDREWDPRFWERAKIINLATSIEEEVIRFRRGWKDD